MTHNPDYRQLHDHDQYDARCGQRVSIRLFCPQHGEVPRNELANPDLIVTTVPSLAAAMKTAEQRDHGLFVHEHTHHERAAVIFAVLKESSQAADK